MFHWLKALTSGCCDNPLTPDDERVAFLRKEVVNLQEERDKMYDELASCDKLLCEAEARNYKLAVDLAEARRQSDAFEKISREACAELESLKRATNAKAAPKRKKTVA